MTHPSTALIVSISLGCRAPVTLYAGKRVTESACWALHDSLYTSVRKSQMLRQRLLEKLLTGVVLVRRSNSETPRGLISQLCVVGDRKLAHALITFSSGHPYLRSEPPIDGRIPAVKMFGSEP